MSVALLDTLAKNHELQTRASPVGSLTTANIDAYLELGGHVGKKAAEEEAEERSEQDTKGKDTDGKDEQAQQEKEDGEEEEDGDADDEADDEEKQEKGARWTYEEPDGKVAEERKAAEAAWEDKEFIVESVQYTEPVQRAEELARTLEGRYEYIKDMENEASRTYKSVGRISTIWLM